MNPTRLIASLAIAGLVLVSCKNEENKRLPLAAAEKRVPKKHREIATENLQTASFKISGMTCAIGCAKTIEKELSNLDGVEKAIVDFDKKTAIVTYDKTAQDPEKLTATVVKAGDGKSYKVSDMKI